VNRGRLDPIHQRIASLTPERRAMLEQWLMIFQTLEQVARLCMEAPAVPTRSASSARGSRPR
jgi:hypothetical protein